MGSTLVRWFSDLRLADRPLVGGKGASLGELTAAGIPVPDGFVVTTDAFTRWLDQLDAAQGIREKIGRLDPDDLGTINTVTAEVRALITATPLDEALVNTIGHACSALGETSPVAVRSSATSEDSEEASFAGLQDTYLWVLGKAQVLERIRECWASLYTPESVTYRRRLDLPEADLAMAVVVQEMVQAACAGVMFTRSPTTGDRSVVTIEASWGLGSSLVSGEVTPDRFVLNKVTGETISRDIACKHIAHVPVAGGGTVEEAVAEDRQNQACLDGEHLSNLLATAKKIEKHYGCPQDIEWAFDQDGRLLMLQSRPETVWAAKDKAPVAKPAMRAFDHIFSTLGGRQAK